MTKYKLKWNNINSLALYNIPTVNRYFTIYNSIYSAIKRISYGLQSSSLSRSLLWNILPPIQFDQISILKLFNSYNRRTTISPGISSVFQNFTTIVSNLLVRQLILRIPGQGICMTKTIVVQFRKIQKCSPVQMKSNQLSIRRTSGSKSSQFISRTQILNESKTNKCEQLTRKNPKRDILK